MGSQKEVFGDLIQLVALNVTHTHTHQLPSVYLWPTQLPRPPATCTQLPHLYVSHKVKCLKAKSKAVTSTPTILPPSQSIATSALQHLRQKSPHLLQLNSQYGPASGSQAHLKTAASLHTVPAPQAPPLSSTRDLYPDR